jgi:hypothetical protein
MLLKREKNFMILSSFIMVLFSLLVIPPKTAFRMMYRPYHNVIRSRSCLLRSSASVPSTKLLISKLFFKPLRTNTTSVVLSNSDNVENADKVVSGGESVLKAENMTPSKTSLKLFNETLKRTGAFAKSWPVVHLGPSHYRNAYKTAQKTVKVDKTIKNQRNQARKHSAIFIDSVMQALTKPLSQYLLLYSNNFRSLHPYETTVAQLTVIARQKQGLPSLEVSSFLCLSFQSDCNFICFS